MSEEKQQEATTDVKSDTAVATPAEATPKKEGAADAPAAEGDKRGPRRRRGGSDRRGGDRRGGRRNRRGGRQERVRPEFDQKIVSIRRVTRVNKLNNARAAVEALKQLNVR
jgi:hypothetical protein